MFHVDSEVGRLRQVILHRPDLELKRLTPENAADLLFDDVLWVSRAQAEHDAFATALRSRGVIVHYYGDLLAQTLEIREARDYILDRVFDPRWHGPLAAATLRAALAGRDSEQLGAFLAGGITTREIAASVQDAAEHTVRASAEIGSIQDVAAHGVTSIADIQTWTERLSKSASDLEGKVADFFSKVRETSNANDWQSRTVVGAGDV